jgi:two-component system NtrC family sensor kinase
MAGHGQRARSRVLVVDDEPLVANAARRLLARFHEVEVAHSGQAALERLGNATFEVIVCDVMMPRMSGIELHDRLVHLAPVLAARMIFLTGGVFDDAAERFLRTHHHRWMGKPFDPAALLSLVGEHIARAGVDTLALGARMV